MEPSFVGSQTESSSHTTIAVATTSSLDPPARMKTKSKRNSK